MVHTASLAEDLGTTSAIGRELHIAENTVRTLADRGALVAVEDSK
jgi:hypothetical protein